VQFSKARESVITLPTLTYLKSLLNRFQLCHKPCFLLYLQLHLDSHHGAHTPNSPDRKDHDFFKEVESQSFQQTVVIPTNGKNGNNSGKWNVKKISK